MAEEAKDATAVVVARAPPGDPKIASVGLRRSNRDDDGRRVLGLLGHGSYSGVIVRAARGPWCERGSLGGAAIPF